MQGKLVFVDKPAGIVGRHSQRYYLFIASYADW